MKDALPSEWHWGEDVPDMEEWRMKKEWGPSDNGKEAIEIGLTSVEALGWRVTDSLLDLYSRFANDGRNK